MAVAQEFFASKASQVLRLAFGVASSSTKPLERTTAQLEGEGEINYSKVFSSLQDLTFQTDTSSAPRTTASSFPRRKFHYRRWQGRLGSRAPTLKNRSLRTSHWAAWRRRTLPSSASARRKRYRLGWPESLCLSFETFCDSFISFYFARILGGSLQSLKLTNLTCNNWFELSIEPPTNYSVCHL